MKQGIVNLYHCLLIGAKGLHYISGLRIGPQPHEQCPDCRGSGAAPHDGRIFLSTRKSH